MSQPTAVHDPLHGEPLAVDLDGHGARRSRIRGLAFLLAGAAAIGAGVRLLTRPAPVEVTLPADRAALRDLGPRLDSEGGD